VALKVLVAGAAAAVLLAPGAAVLGVATLLSPATSSAMKITPSSDPGMVIRSPTAFAQRRVNLGQCFGNIELVGARAGH